MAKKAKKTLRDKKKKQVDEQKEGIKRCKTDIQKGRMNTPFLSLSLTKKRQQKRKLFRKTWFFEMTGKYVKGEDKEGTEKG